jgi:CsoR family transcriptional regulator, copper-sensing transcriptional repressor
MSKNLNKSQTKKLLAKKSLITPKEKKSCCETMQHPDHANLLPNLNRVSGQIEGVKKMITERRYCPDILQQLKSAKSAINSIESAMLEAHMDACVVNAFNSSNEKEKAKKIAELKVLYRRFNN